MDAGRELLARARPRGKDGNTAITLATVKDEIDTQVARSIADEVNTHDSDICTQAGEVQRVFDHTASIRKLYAGGAANLVARIAEEIRRTRKPHRLALGDKVKYHVTSSFGGSYWRDGTIQGLTRNFRGDPAYIVQVKDEHTDNFGGKTKTITDSRNEIRSVADHAAKIQAQDDRRRSNQDAAYNDRIARNRSVQHRAATDVFEKVLLNDGLGLGITLAEGADHAAIKSAIATALQGHVFSRW